MEFVKQLEELLENVAKENEALQNALTDTVRLTDYAPDGEIWTKAFQQALNEHETVIIPASEQPYMIDAPVVVPGDRRIIAEEGAVIRMTRKPPR